MAFSKLVIGLIAGIGSVAAIGGITAGVVVSRQNRTQTLEADNSSLNESSRRNDTNNSSSTVEPEDPFKNEANKDIASEQPEQNETEESRLNKQNQAQSPVVEKTEKEQEIQKAKDPDAPSGMVEDKRKEDMKMMTDTAPTTSSQPTTTMKTTQSDDHEDKADGLQVVKNDDGQEKAQKGPSVDGMGGDGAVNGAEGEGEPQVL